jgi:hypothetical protein
VTCRFPPDAYAIWSLILDEFQDRQFTVTDVARAYSDQMSRKRSFTVVCDEVRRLLKYIFDNETGVVERFGAKNAGHGWRVLVAKDDILFPVRARMRTFGSGVAA